MPLIACGSAVHGSLASPCAFACAALAHLCIAPDQVFFTRDGAKFPDLMHAFLPSPVNGLFQAWRTADILGQLPEAMNMVRRSCSFVIPTRLDCLLVDAGWIRKPAKQ